MIVCWFAKKISARLLVVLYYSLCLYHKQRNHPVGSLVQMTVHWLLLAGIPALGRNHNMKGVIYKNPWSNCVYLFSCASYKTTNSRV